MESEDSLLLFFEPGLGEKSIQWNADDACKLVDLLPGDVGFGWHGDVDCCGPCQVLLFRVIRAVSTFVQRE